MKENNIPSILRDLNRYFPGRPLGTPSDMYAYQFVEKVIKHFHYLIDLHTASFGRINSLYVRADLTSPMTAKMAYLQNPQILLHNKGTDGSLRSAAADLGIPAIAVEVGNPLRFQKTLIKSSLLGLQNVLRHLKMIPRSEAALQGRACGLQEILLALHRPGRSFRGSSRHCLYGQKG